MKPLASRTVITSTYPTQPVIVPKEQGKSNSVLGGVLTIKITAEETNGAFSVVEGVYPPQTGPPLHVHEEEDEIFYLLEGEFETQVGSVSFKASAGAWLSLPRKIPHGYKCVGNSSGKVLLVITPGGFEKSFVEIASLPPDPQDMKKIIEIFARYGCEFL